MHGTSAAFRNRLTRVARNAPLLAYEVWDYTLLQARTSHPLNAAAVILCAQHAEGLC